MSSSSFLESIQSLFGGANRFNEQKLKTNLKILSGRIKLLTDKRRARIASNESAIAKVLETSSFKAMPSSLDGDNVEEDARGGFSSAEKSKAMETLLARCELIGKETKFLEILKHVQSFASAILETCERHPSELELTGKNRTAVASIFYAKSADGGRLVNDLPELKSIANELAKKFGKEFALSCEREKTSEACGVSKAFMVIAKERRNDNCGKEARVLLEKMAKEKGVALPTTSAKKKPSSSSKKKKKSTRRSKSSSEASNSSGESFDIDNTSSSRRKSNKTSNYASAETAAKAARDAANKAQEAAEYAEALVATNELFGTTLKHDDDDDDLNIGTEKEDEINSIIVAAADEAKLEEERNENENKESSDPLRRKTNGGPPPGVASAKNKKTVVDDALADRFEKLKTTKK